MYTNNIILQCRDIHKWYDQSQVLDSIDMDVCEEEFIALLGPSGCGKTTLLRIIAGFEEIQNGTLLFKNKLVTNKRIIIPPEQRKIGMVFQDYALFPHLDVSRNIAFGLRGEKRQKKCRVSEMLELVGLEAYSKFMPYELSGGQQQRVAVARALAPNPSLILMDEPFSNLDTKLRTQLRKDIRQILKKEKVAAVLVTHDQLEAFSFSNRIIVMNNGVVEQAGTPESIYQNPKNTWIASFTGTANILEGEYLKGEIKTVLGSFSYPNRKIGSKYKILIRPEQLKIELTTKEQRNGQIEEIEFLGEKQNITIALKSGEKLIVTLPSYEKWELKSYLKVYATQVHPL